MPVVSSPPATAASTAAVAIATAAVSAAVLAISTPLVALSSAQPAQPTILSTLASVSVMIQVTRVPGEALLILSLRLSLLARRGVGGRSRATRLIQ